MGPRFTAFLREFWWFGLKEAWACLFGGLLLAGLLATAFWYPKDALLPRYDFLFLYCLAIQATLLALRLETWEESRVILVFHVAGTIMELFKTHFGSWQYPEANYLRLAGVPLFSGFMYSAVGSYIARAWRGFDLRFSRFPGRQATALLGLAIYVNFFAHHYLPDFRLLLFVGVLWLFGPAKVHYTVLQHARSMPLIVGLALVALFIWIAENIGTFGRVWLYPNQQAAFVMVSIQKLGSWFLLMIVSFVLVSLVHRPQPPD
ncbi:MAG: DUF817 domain-containing protein [Rhodocyclaceae bacterium]|nr:DUF817 domain-containing protein [Rhodocyclaceae bacterium]